MPLRNFALFILFSATPALFLSGCVTTNDPLIGHATETLKGCEFGPPDELLTDLQKAEAYIGTYNATLNELKSMNFFGTPKELVMPSLIEEVGGDVSRAETNYEVLASMPLNQAKLTTLVGNISQRLSQMEAVRKESGYAEKVHIEGKLNQDMKEAQQANSNFLENQRNANATFYNGLEGADYVSYKNSYGTTYTESTLKGKIREQTIAQEKLLDAQIERSHQQITESRQQASNALATFSSNNENFELIKNFISDESDQITLEEWPKLKAAIKDIENFASQNADLAK